MSVTTHLGRGRLPASRSSDTNFFNTSWQRLRRVEIANSDNPPAIKVLSGRDKYTDTVSIKPSEVLESEDMNETWSKVSKQLLAKLSLTRTELGWPTGQGKHINKNPIY